MKRFTKILAIVLTLSMTCLLLASCGFSGTYVGGSTEITFKGNKITIEKSSMKAEGTYEIDGDKLIIKIDDSTNSLFANTWEGEHNFEKGDNYIKIGIFTYNKK